MDHREMARGADPGWREGRDGQPRSRRPEIVVVEGGGMGPARGQPDRRGYYGRLIVDAAARRCLIERCEAAIEAALTPSLERSAADILAAHQQLLANDASLFGAIESVAPIDPTTLDGVPFPERPWLVPDWIPMARVTGLYGAGGEGKTLVAQMLATSCAVGKDWLGLTASKCRSLLFFCEDDLDEMQRRQELINRAYGCTFGD